ncbi:triosephosphate isomerase protein, putative [Babesia bigemina]|uniref:Triosephosphate isomerase n=1 Tax=Babesia bigemina TaxID=5866 RepID=A0A061D7T9_BABBI|nr:triosephosphate isomerase protein, putative [Babesia bigemina]CDR94974.1 triosephosphate isomerase protein, putative [Babesia bigemina]|eukprot:XP_012767160.1 triosephosphate isomerase protein, putative [Babesia bigemina]
MAVVRRRWLGGNWKCNGSRELVSTLSAVMNEAEFDVSTMGTCSFSSKHSVSDVVLFPSSLYVVPCLEKFKLERFKVGVQNISQAKPGAFTGELAVPMLSDLGLEWTLIGHSERRSMFGETDEDVAAKVAITQQAKLNAAVCIGENLTEREDGLVGEVITRQLNAFMAAVTDWSLVVIAYEPVWAIGTGKVATTAEVLEAHQLIRDLLTEKIGAVADTVRIVYGGSVNENNCVDLMQTPNVDGFLVGGKSIAPAFCEIIAAVNNTH